MRNPFHNKNHHRTVGNSTWIGYYLIVWRGRAPAFPQVQMFFVAYWDYSGWVCRAEKRMLSSIPFHGRPIKIEDANGEIMQHGHWTPAV